MYNCEINKLDSDDRYLAVIWLSVIVSTPADHTR